MSQVLKCQEMAAQGHSVRAIARRLGISRNTARIYLRGERQAGEYRLSKGRPRPVSEPLEARVRELLTAEVEARTPRKQRLTAARMERILAGEGLIASSSTVRAVVRRVRLELRDPLQHAYVPLEYQPGQDAQVDFFEAEVEDITKGRTKCFILLVRACYSARTFAYAAPNQTKEALFEGLMLAFAFFGGVFLRLWFDNLTPAVRKILIGRQRVEQQSFMHFRAHYGFEAEFCAPGKGNEKGGVEGAVKYSRHEILSPIPKVKGRADLQALCDAWMTREQGRVARGHDRTIGERWQDEVDHLRPLPKARFEASLPSTAQVTPRSWISHGTNFYSVPVEWVGRKVTVRVDAERVVIFGPNAVRVEHARCYEMHRMELVLDHYLPLLRRKHRSLDHAVPLQRFLAKEAGEWGALLRALRQHEGVIDGSKQFVDVLMMCREHGTETVLSAVRQALRRPAVSKAIVRVCLGLQREAEASTAAPIDYAGPEVHQGSPEDYAVLLSTMEVAHG